MNCFNGKSILITGGLGFIGSNLARRLVELGAKPVLIDSLIPEYGGNLWNVEAIRGRVTVNISDVRDEYSMKYLIQGHDYLFNLAGQTSHLDSMDNPFPDLEINARAQLSILESCRKYNPGIKVVFASTRQVYGKPISNPVDERHPIAPVDVNGVNKVAGESYHLLYNNVYGLRSAVLRLTNTYGPCMRVKDARQTFLGVWIKRLIEGEPLLVFGDGKQIRDFNYVDDVVRALLVCAEADEANGEIFNLGADDPISLMDAAELMVRIAGGGSWKLVPFPVERKSIDIGDYYGDYRKIRSRLGWRPEVPLEDGLRQTLSYFKQNCAHYWDQAKT